MDNQETETESDRDYRERRNVGRLKIFMGCTLGLLVGLIVGINLENKTNDDRLADQIIAKNSALREVEELKVQHEANNKQICDLLDVAQWEVFNRGATNLTELDNKMTYDNYSQKLTIGRHVYQTHVMVYPEGQVAVGRINNEEWPECSEPVSLPTEP